MNNGITVETSRDERTRTSTITAHVKDKMIPVGMQEAIYREVAKQMAAKIVAEHFQEIMAKIDMQALANLSVAEGAAAIRKTLAEKIPDKIMEVHKQAEIYQRGVFGGIKRIG